MRIVYIFYMHMLRKKYPSCRTPPAEREIAIAFAVSRDDFWLEEFLLSAPTASRVKGLR